MEFLNIGTAELLIIVLLALILFGPEDIVKLMRTLGRYTRQARNMWKEFSTTLEQEYALKELNEVLDETKASFAEAEKAIGGVKTSVEKIGASVGEDLAGVQETLTSEARESAAALEQQVVEAETTLRRGATVPSVSGWAGANRRTMKAEDTTAGGNGSAVMDAEVAAEDAEVAVTDAEVAVTDAEVVVEDADVAATDAEVAAEDAEVAAEDAEAAAEDAEVAVTDAEVAATDAEVVATDAEVVATDAEIVATDAEIAVEDAEVAAKDADVAVKDAEVTVKRAEVATKAPEVVAKDAEVAMEDAKVAVKDAEVAVKNAEAAAKNAEVAATDAEVAAELPREAETVQEDV